MARIFKYMTLEQRLQIKTMIDNGCSKSTIAECLGFHRSSVYREIERGSVNGSYDPYYAQKMKEDNLEKRGSVNKIAIDNKMAQYIADLILLEHLSPKKIVNRLKENNMGFANIPKSPTTIYNAIDNGIIPGVTRESLRTDKTTIFSGGQICIAKWVMEKLDLKDGDTLYFEVTDDGKLIYIKKEDMI